MNACETLHLWRQTSWVVISSSVPGGLGSNSCLYLGEHRSVQLPLAHRGMEPLIAPPRVHSTVLSFPIPVEDPPSLQGLTSPVECLSLVGEVYTWRTVFFFEHQQQSPHFSKALWSNSAVLRGICYLKSSGSRGIESWLFSFLLHCELLLAI